MESMEASSFRFARLSVDISMTYSRLSAVCTNIRFRRYQVKSVTNCTSSLPCMTISSNSSMHPNTFRSMTKRSNLLNTSVSTAPNTSRVMS